MGAAVTLVIGIISIFVIKAVFTYFRVDEQKINKFFKLEN